MKKAKVVSIIAVMIAVVALGIFMGKQMFKLLEADSSVAVKPRPDTASSSVKILYKADEQQVAAVKPPAESVKSAYQGQSSAEPKPVAAVESTAVKAEAKSTPSFNPETDKWFAYASVKGVNVRFGPTTSSKALFKVAKGTRGRVTAKESGWTQIKWDFNKQTGWVRDDLLVQGPAEAITVLVAKADDISKIDMSKIAAAAPKNDRQKANNSSKPNNEKLAIALAKPAPVSETAAKGKLASDLPKQGIITPNNAAKANIRSGPATSRELLSKLPKGLMVQIKSAKKVGKYFWYEIIYNNGKNSGWTRGDNLKF